jgi:signal transduction histidine kinase
MWAVVRDISDRKQAEAAVRESESWLSSAMEIASIGRYSQTGPSDDRSTFLDDRARRLLDSPPDQEAQTHSYWIQHIHPADLTRVADVSARFESGGPARAAVEYRYRRRSDETVWIRHVAEALERDASGRAVRVVGILQDVTDQKLAEDALHNLSKRLIGAHEEERARVSRELHDGLSQSLALIAIKLDVLRQSAPATGRAYRRNITEILETVNHLSTDVHRISRDLHPMRLEQQGLEAAIRGLCRELLSAGSTAIEYELRDIPRDLPWDVALCLYRVLQEALHNVLKHSRATAVKVSAWRDGAELRLAVADNGVGFSPTAPRIAVSAGLANMRVRVSSVAGRIHLESAHGKGTRIEVAVPVAEQADDPGER